MCEALRGGGDRGAAADSCAPPAVRYAGMSMAEYALVGGADMPLGDTDAGAQERRKSASE